MTFHWHWVFVFTFQLGVGYVDWAVSQPMSQLALIIDICCHFGHLFVVPWKAVWHIMLRPHNKGLHHNNNWVSLSESRILLSVIKRPSQVFMVQQCYLTYNRMLITMLQGTVEGDHCQGRMWKTKSRNGQSGHCHPCCASYMTEVDGRQQLLQIRLSKYLMTLRPNVSLVTFNSCAAKHYSHLEWDKDNENTVFAGQSPTCAKNDKVVDRLQ